tara:strand:+ start:196 stop:435 length:240 start_codon:yes stop_codon:yes gene_type:complete
LDVVDLADVVDVTNVTDVVEVTNVTDVVEVTDVVDVVEVTDVVDVTRTGVSSLPDQHFRSKFVFKFEIVYKTDSIAHLK